MRELGRSGDFDVSIALDDWNKTVEAFRAGKLDAIAMAQTRERRDWAAFAATHATPVFAVYFRHGQATPTGVQALEGHTIAVHESDPMRETIASFFGGERYRFLRVSTPLEALRAVRDGRADYALMPRAYGDRALAAGPVEGVDASNFGLELQAYSFAVAPSNPMLLDRLNRALAQLEQSGKLEAMRVRWLESHRDVRERGALERRLLWQGTFGVAGLVTASATIVLLARLARRRSAVAAAERVRRISVEQALADAEARLDRAFLHHPDGMVITERDTTRIIEINDALCRLVGERPEAMLGQPVTSLSAISDPAALETLRALLESEGGLHGAPLQLRRPDGDVRSCIVHAEPFVLEGEECVFSIIRDVTDQMRADEALRHGYDMILGETRKRGRELQATRRALARTEETLRTYTRAVAHDMGAPVRAIRGFSAMVKEDIEAGRLDEAVTFIDRIDVAAKRMSAMLPGFSRLANVDRTPLALETVGMTELAQEAWDLACTGAPARSVAFLLSPLPAAFADTALVAQVWQNLLDNAFKYTLRVADPKVGVDAFTEEGRVWYRVADNGAGFDPAYSAQLFEPFRRLHAEGEFAGTGVGLSIVHRIVERHGGDIRARGEVGVGAVFEFTLTAAGHAAA